ncbi:hypothetical protein [Rhodococcoides fascians]|uniref:hypothetical protein n=1 Tax=Rhodococcoides fascians TaxID=1828 RepID=UPI000A4EAC9E|nr:hypothetical protein [Rhodococcus fascians]
MSKNTPLTEPGLSRTKIGPTVTPKPVPKPAGNFPKGGSATGLPKPQKRHTSF